LTPTAMAVAALIAGGVTVVMVPDGARARWALRRSRGSSGPDRRSARPWASSMVATDTTRIVAPVLEPVGRRLRAVVRRSPEPRADLRVGVAALAGAVVALLIGPLVALPVSAIVWGVPSWRDRSTRRSHDRSVRATLPDVIDLFRLAVGAGLSVHQAIDAVAPRAPEPARSALEEVRRRVALGDRLGDALEVLDTLGDPVLPLAAALRGAAWHGAPLATGLERVASDARVLRRRRAEEEARRLPVQLLFPLVLCVLPAFGLLAVVPLLLASLRSLQL
jgi:tight adherence protein C